MNLPDIHDETLDNGLHLLLRETHLAPVVSVQIWARVGSADERPDEAGLAHFHEHMLFKGTERRGVGAVAGEVEGAGGRINAYTSFDVTVYYATLPSDALDTGLEVLTDAVRHSIFDEAEIAREQEVVIEEIRRSEDSPGHVLSDLVFQQAFLEHPYRAPILGSPESVASLDRRRCLAFFERWYAADNLTVVVAGDFDTRRVRDRIAELFAGAARGNAHRDRRQEPRHDRMRTAIARRSFEGQRFELAWPAARFRDDDATHLDLLSFLLGECESSRLVQGLRERKALVDKIDSSAYTPFDRGLFSINFETDEERCLRALEAVGEAVERLRREPVRRDELERARANYLASEHFERESVSGLASKLGHFELLGSGWRSEAHYFDTLRNAKREDLLRVADEYLSPEQLTAGALIPESSGSTLDEQSMAAALMAGVDRARKRPRKTPRKPPVRRAVALEAASAMTPRTYRGSEVHTYPLPGGGVLHVEPRRSVPVVAARAAFVGGLLADEAATAGLSSFVSSMWSRGTQSHSAAEFARAVEDLAADVSGFSGRSSLGVTLESTSDKLPQAVDLMCEILLEPRFDEAELERERRETLAAIDRRQDQLAQQVFQLFGETEFLSHPYRLPMLGTRESVETFSCDLVRAHHTRWLRAPNLVLAVAGDVDPDEIATRFGEKLVGLPAGPFSRPDCPDEPLSTGLREAVLHKDRAQAHLVIGFRGTDVADPDRHVLELISQLLGGQGGRLFLDLRDRQSLAYSVSAMNVEGLSPGYFAVYIGTAPEKLEAARAGIFDHLKRLIDEAPDELELTHARRHMIGNHAIDQQRSATRAAHMALDSLYGLGPDAQRAYPAQIAAISREDVLRVARRFFRLDACTIATVCP